ncbi:MAG: YjgN family protein [Spirochaetia bacterium]|nr:YjgN family protein [Spirochaetia bacterium]
MENQTTRIKFDGEGWPLFKLYLSNLLLSIFTLGVYYFWAKVKTKKYFYNHTSFQDSRFEYHATGKEKLIGFIKGLVMIGIPFALILYGLPKLFEMFNVNKTFAATFPPLLIYVIFISILPFIVYGSRKFQLARSSWNAVHFRFNGNVKDLYKIIFKGFFFSIITLGIYSSWFRVKLDKYLIDKSTIGNQEFFFDGAGKDVFYKTLLAMLLIPFTFGFYAFHYKADLERYYWQHTFFQGNMFKSDMSGTGLLKVTFLSFFITVFTLGFGFAWAIIIKKKYLLETISFTGEVDLLKIQAVPDSSADALAEGISEAGDFLDTIGEFFG